MKPTTNMIWHICKKDLKLLWPFVLGAAGIQVTSAGLCYAMDHIRVTEALLNISNLLQLRSEEHTSELQSRLHLVCRLLLEKKNIQVDSLGHRVALACLRSPRT